MGVFLPGKFYVEVEHKGPWERIVAFEKQEGGISRILEVLAHQLVHLRSLKFLLILAYMLKL